jgi:hypothetical protein
MDLYYKKYLKYKNKYLNLKKIYIGGDTNKENLEKIINDCTHFQTQNIYDKSVCKYCPFNNAGSNQNPNSCKKISGNVDKCFHANNIDDAFNPDGSYKTIPDRMDINLFSTGTSNFVLENNIQITPPSGEVCFGNTITTCLTICIILENNVKISLHINPATTFFDLENLLIRQYETINPFNLIGKIKEKIEESYSLFGESTIKKIIILGAAAYKIYVRLDSQGKFGKKFICDDIVDFMPVNKFESTTINVSDFILDSFKKYYVNNPEYIENYNINISDGAVYIVKADGTGIIYNSDNSIRDTF